MTHYHEAGKGPERRPTKNQRMADANWEIKDGGWRHYDNDPPGSIAAEVRVFFNKHDPDEGVKYWKPLETEK